MARECVFGMCATASGPQLRALSLNIELFVHNLCKGQQISAPKFRSFLLIRGSIEIANLHFRNQPQSRYLSAVSHGNIFPAHCY